MRTPVHRIHGAPRASAKSPAEELLCEELLKKNIAVARDKAIDYIDEAGEKQQLRCGFALPDHRIVVEVNEPERQKDKDILGEMSRDKAARAGGWRTCRFAKKEVLADPAWVVHKIQFEIAQGKRR